MILRRNPIYCLQLGQPVTKSSRSPGSCGSVVDVCCRNGLNFGHECHEIDLQHPLFFRSLRVNVTCVLRSVDRRGNVNGKKCMSTVLLRLTWRSVRKVIKINTVIARKRDL